MAKRPTSGAPFYTQYGCLIEVAFDAGFAVISHYMKIVQQGDVDIVERP